MVQHDAWTRAINSESATSPISDWLTEVLGATGLSLVHHAKLMAPDGSSTQHFAFLGPNGCKLSLFISPRPDESPVPLEYSISQALLTAHWSEGGRGYALIARTMNDARFVAIASAVHEVSRRRGVIDDQLLAEMRDARQPCIG